MYVCVHYDMHDPPCCELVTTTAWHQLYCLYNDETVMVQLVFSSSAHSSAVCLQIGQCKRSTMLLMRLFM